MGRVSRDRSGADLHGLGGSGRDGSETGRV
jgi:hypothetical protein